MGRNITALGGKRFYSNSTCMTSYCVPGKAILILCSSVSSSKNEIWLIPSPQDRALLLFTPHLIFPSHTAPDTSAASVLHSCHLFPAQGLCIPQSLYLCYSHPVLFTTLLSFISYWLYYYFKTMNVFIFLLLICYSSQNINSIEAGKILFHYY